MTAAGQIPLFQEAAAVTLSASALTSVDALADRAVAAIRDVMAQGKRVVVSCSFGKDSSVVLALALRALHAERDAGNDQTSVTVLTSNTGMENPVQDFYVAEEIRKVEAYAATHRLPLSVRVARPSLSNNYLVNVLGGRMVATTPEMKARTCSNMMKVQPLTRAKRRLFAALGVAGDDIVSLVGTRFSESPERAIRMRERGETADHPFRSPQGEWMMSPIADWTGDQVFEYIGLVCSGLIPCYSDFEALVRFYRDAAEGECMVSAFVDGKQAARPCGSTARSGCWGCLAVSDDHSMVSMLKKIEYNWMRPLYQFRGVLKAFHLDLSRRSWLARTLNDDGTINVAPNAYSPAHCLALLRWALTVDVREQEAAAATAGALQAAFGYDGEIQPRFRVLCETEVLAIALLWGRYGYGAPLQPLREYHHIVVRGMRYDMPEGIQDAPMQPIPAPQAVPFADADYDDTFAGFRDLAATVAGAACERVTGSGMVVADAREALEFDIDAEGAELFFAIELDRAIHLFDQAASPTAGFLYLARLGVVAFHRGSASEQDRMLRLANQIWRSGIGELLDQPEALVRRLSGSGTLSSSPLQLAF